MKRSTSYRFMNFLIEKSGPRQYEIYGPILKSAGGQRIRELLGEESSLSKAKEFVIQGTVGPLAGIDFPLVASSPFILEKEGLVGTDRILYGETERLRELRSGEDN